MMAADRRDRDLGEGLEVLFHRPPRLTSSGAEASRRASPFSPSLLDPMPLIVPDPACRSGPICRPPQRRRPWQAARACAGSRYSPLPQRRRQQPPPDFDYEYRVLPNGTIVKVR